MIVDTEFIPPEMSKVIKKEETLVDKAQSTIATYRFVAPYKVDGFILGTAMVTASQERIVEFMRKKRSPRWGKGEYATNIELIECFIETHDAHKILKEA